MQNTRIGQYLIIRLIAVGGQAKIYEAVKNNSSFAIKVYDSYSEMSCILFAKEKQLIESMNHQGILSELTYRESETLVIPDMQSVKRNIVIMKFIRNGDLMNQVIKNGPIEDKIVLRITKNILNCLIYLNQKSIYHGDLKPENILLTQKFKPLLIDFGFTTNKDDFFHKQYPKQYNIAPQVKKGLAYTQKSEAFSLGVLIFILLAGRPPFKMAKHTDISYRSLLQGKHELFWKKFEQNLNFGLRDNIKKAIINLLQPNPKRRWGYKELLQSDWMSQDLLTQQQYLQSFTLRYYIQAQKQETKVEMISTDAQEFRGKYSCQQSL